jgi:hypothetical protein
MINDGIKGWWTLNLIIKHWSLALDFQTPSSNMCIVNIQVARFNKKTSTKKTLKV